jgi:predicted aspartyl protease
VNHGLTPIHESRADPNIHRNSASIGMSASLPMTASDTASAEIPAAVSNGVEARSVKVRVGATVAVGVAVSVAAIWASTGTAGRAAQPPHAIKFSFKTKQPLVPVRVNGGAEVPFVVDTGASIHVVDRELARQSNVSAGRQSQLSGGGQATVDVQFVDGLRLEAGGLAWEGQRAIVASLGYPDKKHFAGLIGAPILMRYTVRFDFRAETMQLIAPAAYTPPVGAAQVPFELQENLPIVKVLIDAGSGPIEARLVVDTGAGTFIDLNRPFVEAHKLVELMSDAAAADRPAALGGTAPFLYGTGRRVTFAGVAFDKPRLGLSRAQGGSSARSERDGIIGNELLRHFAMTVDYRRRVLVLEGVSP